MSLIAFIRIEKSWVADPVVHRSGGGHNTRLHKVGNFRVKPKQGIKGFWDRAADVLEGLVMSTNRGVQTALSIWQLLFAVMAQVLIGAQDLSVLPHRLSVFWLVFVCFPFLELYVLTGKVLFNLWLIFYFWVHPERTAGKFLNLKGLHISGWLQSLVKRCFLRWV